jgi:hypothetical protein
MPSSLYASVDDTTDTALKKMNEFPAPVDVEWKSRGNLDNTTTRTLTWSWGRQGNPDIGGFTLYLSTSKLDAAFEEVTIRVLDPDARSVNLTGLNLGGKLLRQGRHSAGRKGSCTWKPRASSQTRPM